MSEIKSPLSKIVVLVSALGLVLFAQYIFAWTEPTVAPPEGNVAAPLNTGSVDQTKTANLTANNLIANLDVTANDDLRGGALVLGYGGVINNNDADASVIIKGSTPEKGKVGIGTESPSQKLDVAGGTKTTDAYITSAANCTGSLYTDSDGKVICNTDPLNNNNFCNIERTGPLGGLGATGVKTVSMLKNGRNICTDDTGCTYRFFSFLPNDITGIYKDSPIMFWQRPSDTVCNSGSGIMCAIFSAIGNSGKWYDAKGNTEGRNGVVQGEDGDFIQRWGFNDKFVVYDDFNNYKGFTFSDSSPDTLVIMDNDGGNGSSDYAFILCDF